MLKFVIPLEHIILDPTKSLNLPAMSEKDAIDHIRQAYSFLGDDLSIEIHDGVAVITMETDTAPQQDVGKLFNRGGNEAQQGNYKKAIRILSEVLSVVPDRVDVRRNLAMAYLEAGDSTTAKQLLEECLKLDPKDTWTYVLLGNIYAKNEHNLPTAEFYYEFGLSVTPDDHLLLSNYAGLLLQKGDHSKARRFFEKALEVDSTHPNTYYGLALAHNKLGDIDAAVKALDHLFIQATSADIRSELVFDNARSLYLTLAEQLAERDHTELMAVLNKKKVTLEQASGYPVHIEESQSLDYISAVAKIAWKHGRDEHRILYRQKSKAITPHLLAHEMEHIVLEQGAREAGRNLFFTTNDHTREVAARAIAKHVEKLGKQGYEKAKTEGLMQHLLHGICGQIYNNPIDMVIESNLYSKHPELRHSQLVSLHRMFEEGYQPYNNPEVKKVTPPLIYRASTTLNCTFAFFIDDLFAGRTSYAKAYRLSEVYNNSENLLKLWKQKMQEFSPGDEYQLVDAFAEKLNLREWYAWQTDSGTSSPVAPHTPKTQQTQTPLKVDDPRTVTYCKDALDRLMDKPHSEIIKIVSEISTLGMSGIDHRNEEKTYQLRAYPEEKFSGLQLLCLMYVGFKLYDSSIDCGLDFADSYVKAQRANSSSLH